MPPRITLSLTFLLAALTLAALAQYVKLEAASRQQLSPREAAPSEGHFLPGADGELFVREAGKRDDELPLFLFVGAEGSWKNAMNYAADEGFHSIAIDLPPFGYSAPPSGGYAPDDEAQRIAAAAKNFSEPMVTIVAHSREAAPALLVARHLQKTVIAILLVDPVIPTEAPSPLRRLALGWGPTREVIAGLLTQPALQKWLLERRLFRKEAATAENVAALTGPLRARGKSEELDRWLRQSVTVPEPLPEGIFTSVGGSFKFFLSGDHDELSQASELSKRFILPGFSLSVEGTGQLPQLEDPAQFRGKFLTYLLELRSLLVPVELSKR